MLNDRSSVLSLLETRRSTLVAWAFLSAAPAANQAGSPAGWPIATVLGIAAAVAVLIAAILVLRRRTLLARRPA